MMYSAIWRRHYEAARSDTWTRRGSRMMTPNEQAATRQLPKRSPLVPGAPPWPQPGATQQCPKAPAQRAPPQISAPSAAARDQRERRRWRCLQCFGTLVTRAAAVARRRAHAHEATRGEAAATARARATATGLAAPGGPCTRSPAGLLEAPALSCQAAAPQVATAAAQRPWSRQQSWRRSWRWSHLRYRERS